MAKREGRSRGIWVRITSPRGTTFSSNIVQNNHRGNGVTGNYDSVYLCPEAFNGMAAISSAPALWNMCGGTLN